MSDSIENNGENGSTNKCANPECNEIGKLKCSGCSSVYYCSPQCQKKHWSAHKVQCKTTQRQNSSSNSPVPVSPAGNKPPESAAQLQALKAEIQRNFNMGDFENAIKKSEEALRMAKELPPLVAISETIQLHINLSTAFIHMNRLSDSENHADLAVKNAEIAITQRPNQPQPLEVLSIALGSRAVAFLSNNKTEEALEAAQRSLAIAESIYPKNDPRFHKSLRTLGLILDKKGDIANAATQLVKAYTIISLAHGPQAGEAQLLTEDLVGIYSRRGELDTAEKYARKNYQSLKEKQKELKGTEVAILADSATRLAGTLMRKNDLSAAEKLVREALSIRENKEFSSMNPLGIAYSLAQLVSIQEQSNTVTEETEQLLIRALEIFTRIKGPNSPEVGNSLQQLKNIRAKRNNGNASSPVKNSNSGTVTVEDVDDEEDDPQTRKATVPTPSSSSSKMRQNLAKNVSEHTDQITPEDQRRIDALPPNDGVVRMQLAGMMFEQRKFAVAEALLAQAFSIFLNSHGPEHEHTKAARQNLNLVRNNRLNQLWMSVVTEEVLKIEELKISDPSEESSKSMKRSSSSSSEIGASVTTAEDVSTVGEYSKIVSGQYQSSGKDSELTLEERLFLQSTENEKPAASGCILC